MPPIEAPETASRRVMLNFSLTRRYCDSTMSRMVKCGNAVPCWVLLLLEPISKSPEEDNEASELYEAEEVLGVVFPTDDDAALPLNPSKEALHEPASHIAA